MEITISDKISQECASGGRPVVALESTVISHGLPRPKNLETALRLEEIIRDEGALPATVGIIDGQVKVGLNREELEALASCDDVKKVSRRDIAPAAASGEMGATTVAATMAAAYRADVNFFVTGGIGGVHIGAGESFDISADLNELGRTQVAVISSGAKAVLDLQLTLECLETRGVPVVGYRCSTFPAFYCRDSGFDVPARADTVQDLAKIYSAQKSLELETGVLIANPIPDEAALPKETVEKAVDKAMKEARNRDLSGQDLTPYLLDMIKEMTDGKSLEANIALLENNARLGARLALAYQRAQFRKDS